MNGVCYKRIPKSIFLARLDLNKQMSNEGVSQKGEINIIYRNVSTNNNYHPVQIKKRAGLGTGFRTSNLEKPVVGPIDY